LKKLTTALYLITSNLGLPKLALGLKNMFLQGDGMGRHQERRILH